MAKGRMLKKEISESTKLGGLKSDSARLLYTWLIPWLDIEGRYTADLDILKGHLFPKVETMTRNKIKKLLIELAEIGLIYLYKSGEEQYLQFTKFGELQKLHPEREAKSEIPSPNDESCELMINHDLSPQIKVKETNLIQDKYKDIRHEIINYLNEKTGKDFDLDSDIAIKFINGRIDDNKKPATREDFKKVINVKTSDWLNDPKMNKYLRPKTLFSKSNFEGYLNEEIIPKNQQVGLSQFKRTSEEKEAEKEYIEARLKEEKRIKDEGSSYDTPEFRNKMAEWTSKYYKE